jgi:hypothetical protein
MATLQIALLLLSVSYAHSWYPAACCVGSEVYGDCHPVPCDAITAGLMACMARCGFF